MVFFLFTISSKLADKSHSELFGEIQKGTFFSFEDKDFME
jgi:hypothetical protein